MEEQEVDALLARVVKEAREALVPVPLDRIDPHVRLNTRAVARLGCCRPVPEGYIIEISARLLPAGEGAVREVLAHEVLHTCRGCGNHGPRWKAYAQRMNQAYGYHIARTDTFQGLGLPDTRPVRHLVVCQQCGRQFGRTRASALVRHPERYRCQCGGRLVRQY